MLESEKLGLLVWSPLAGGLLAGKYERGRETGAEGRRSQVDFPPVDRERCHAGEHPDDTHQRPVQSSRAAHRRPSERAKQ